MTPPPTCFGLSMVKADDGLAEAEISVGTSKMTNDYLLLILQFVGLNTA